MYDFRGCAKPAEVLLLMKLLVWKPGSIFYNPAEIFICEIRSQPHSSE